MIDLLLKLLLKTEQKVGSLREGEFFQSIYLIKNFKFLDNFINTKIKDFYNPLITPWITRQHVVHFIYNDRGSRHSNWDKEVEGGQNDNQTEFSARNGGQLEKELRKGMLARNLPVLPSPKSRDGILFAPQSDCSLLGDRERKNCQRY